jgi:uncharacterized membrane protein
MNILLLNDNPVVTKLVTLSAQKTGSEIFIASNIDEIQGDSYDLIIVDEALYSLDLMDELKSKITYKHSLYMLSRGAQSVDGFDYEVKKPFLPTDLVELLSSISTALLKINDESVNLENEDLQEDFDMDKDLKAEVFIDSGIIDDDLDLDNLDLNLDNLSIQDDEIGSILDQDEVQEVKNLLDEAELQEDELDFDLDDEFESNDTKFDDEKSLLSSDNLKIEELEDDFSFDDIDLPVDFKEEMPEEKLALQEDSEEELLSEDDEELITPETLLANDEEIDEDDLNFDTLKDDFNFDDIDIPVDFKREVPEKELQVPENSEGEPLLEDDEELIEPETVLVSDEEINEDDLNFDTLEDEIQSAVGALSQDDLDQEIDLNFDDLDEFATLDEKSLKIALGEEVEDVNEDELTFDDELFIETEHELGEEIVPTMKEESSVTQTDGVDALKTLLKALSNEDVVASLKGMNVSINISFGNISDK